MQTHFLKEINIINYKCFKNFKANNLKRINLISGKNNIGKTALMEAFYVNLSSTSIERFYYTLSTTKLMRNNLELIGLNKTEVLKYYKEVLYNVGIIVNSNVNNINFKCTNKDGIRNLNFNINENKNTINVNDFSYNPLSVENIEFIDNFGVDYLLLKRLYEEVQKKDKENILNKLVQEFDSSIFNFKLIGGDKPSCKTLNSKEYIELNEFGDGLRHYISIICALYSCENGQLFIDEIDNGIHYTQLEKLWEIIFTISEEVNCQVFATTHSKEMINAFAKVSQKLESDDMSFIELGRNKKNEIKANIYDQEMFLNEINQNHEVRGW